MKHAPSVQWRAVVLRCMSLLGVCVWLSGMLVPAHAQTSTNARPTISNVRIVTSAPVTFEKFQIEFQVTTTAKNLYLPYDAKPPQGISPGIGISVDALFSTDEWKTSVTQPAFWYQPYASDTRDTRDYFVPDGAPRWAVRFAPQTAGAWQFRLRVRDRGGETLSDAYPFRVQTGDRARYTGLRDAPFSRHGFLRVSAADTRYFEFQDGTPFYGLGYNSEFKNRTDAETLVHAWHANGIQFVRMWLSSDGINGSQWTSWTFPQQPFQNSLPAVPVVTSNAATPNGFIFRLDDKRPCLFTDFWQGFIPVRPNTTYTVAAQVRMDKVLPTEVGGGFRLVAADWPKDCADAGGKNVIPLRLGTTGWETVTGKFTTGDKQYWLPYLWFQRRNASGTVWFDNVRLYASDDAAQVNLLREPTADSTQFFDPLNSAKWDIFLQTAEQNGVYLKLVTDEKNEWLRNLMQKDGNLGTKFDNNNFYAAPDTRVRWLQEAWWRYLIARWGYSTAIHSFEFINEGDPYNGNHYNAANAMADYFRAHDPSQHMVTTSFWHSFPNTEFWSNPKYPAPAYADLHAYISTGWGDNASFIPRNRLETRPAYIHTGAASFHIPIAQTFNNVLNPRGITLQEQGEWVVRYWLKGENIQAACRQNTSRVRILWMLDGGSARGGKSGSVPTGPVEPNAPCGSPAGTFDWTQFSSQTMRQGQPAPETARIMISDNAPHELNLFVSNERGTGGDAWIDDVELISPSGQRVPVLGTMDTTSFTSDTAWYTAAYSELFGAHSPVGARKPLVRGESGLDAAGAQKYLATLNQDQDGLWLHNFIWGQINPGGMYDLLWWGSSTIENNPDAGRNGALWAQYQAFFKFMQGIPLNNGHYRDAQAITTEPTLRAWGQRDDANGRAHLWLQNTAHQWDRVLGGETITPVQGTVTLQNMPAGTYHIEWWDPYQAQSLRTETQIVTDTLRLTIAPLADDIAVRITRLTP